MACRNILGRYNGDGGTHATEALARVETDIRGAAIVNTRDQQLDEIHDTDDLAPTRVALVRELAGFPLCLYSRLTELESAYLDRGLDQQRKTCHIRYREKFEDLPDIVLVEDEQYRTIREYCDYVLRGILLRFIERDGDGVFCANILIGAIGERVHPLGTKLNRIIKHGCTVPIVRDYLKRRWQRWSEDATPNHFAALFNALQQSRNLIRKRLSRLQGDQSSKSLPILNCLYRLLIDTAKNLRKTDEGQQWYELLRDRDHENDSQQQIDEWKARYPGIEQMITSHCLTAPHDDGVPIFQVNERSVGSLTLPGAPSTP